MLSKPFASKRGAMVVAICVLLWPGGEDGWGVRNAAHAGETQSIAELAHLLASDAAPSDIFGFRLAIDSDTALIGALGHDTEPGPIGGQGAAYVFVRNGIQWVQQAKLTASDAEALDQFGCSVALAGDIAVIGAYMPAGAKTGAVYVFERTGEPGSEVWTQIQKLTASDGDGFDYFGTSVAIAGEWIVVGAARADTNAGIDAGAVYLFKRTGDHWNQSAKLTAPDASPESLFGNAVAISIPATGSQTVVVGAYQHGLPGGFKAGKVYVFVRDGGQWTLQADLHAPDYTAFDEFGHDVSIRAGTLLIGAPFHPINDERGAVYIFTRSAAAWTQQVKVIASDGMPHDQFGTSVSLSGDRAAVGARWHNGGGGQKSGAVYVLAFENNAWSEHAKLSASDAAAGDEFGDSVALDGTTAFVGAIFDDTPAGIDAGSVYAFDVNPVALPADLNGDGAVNVQDLLAMLEQWGVCPASPASCPADVAPPPNGDGTVNVIDLLFLLNHWS